MSDASSSVGYPRPCIQPAFRACPCRASRAICASQAWHTAMPSRVGIHPITSGHYGTPKKAADHQLPEAGADGDDVWLWPHAEISPQLAAKSLSQQAARTD